MVRPNDRLCPDLSMYAYIYPTSPLGDKWFRNNFNQITPHPTLPGAPIRPALILGLWSMVLGRHRSSSAYHLSTFARTRTAYHHMSTPMPELRSHLPTHCTPHSARAECPPGRPQRPGNQPLCKVCTYVLSSGLAG